ncbi:ESD [Symbiodinium sp. CCMP2592]|nr:ESD [Symbiodinium sp. CCMP2592]
MVPARSIGVHAGALRNGAHRAQSCKWWLKCKRDPLQLPTPIGDQAWHRRMPCPVSLCPVWHRPTAEDPKMALSRGLLVLSAGVMHAMACEGKVFDQAAFEAGLLGGSIGGIVLGLLMVIFASLPLCCGVLKQYGKVIAAIAIILGLASLIVPFLGSMGACGPFVDHICDDLCPGEIQCSQSDRDNLTTTCNALGFLVVYLGAFGWAACVLGIVAASLGCCVCCQCCKAKLDDGPKPGQPGQPTVVVGAVQQG